MHKLLNKMQSIVSQNKIIIIINAQTDTRLQFSLYSNYLIGLHLLALANTWVDVISH